MLLGIGTESRERDKLYYSAVLTDEAIPITGIPDHVMIHVVQAEQAGEELSSHVSRNHRRCRQNRSRSLLHRRPVFAPPVINAISLLVNQRARRGTCHPSLPVSIEPAAKLRKNLIGMLSAADR